MEKQQKIEELARVGLRSEQAELYLLLIKHGRMTAGKLAGLTSLSRPMVYKVLDELVSQSLVRKIDTSDAVTVFESNHPLVLRELIDRKRSEIEQKHIVLESILGELVTDYTAAANQPGVRILRGLSGIDELYDDILNESKPIALLRSPKDNHFPELFEKVLEQIQAQVAAGITTRAITPFTDETVEEITDIDRENLVTRRLVGVDTFNIPAQIIIYADKVAITAFDKELITTIIQNAAIATTFSLIFEFMWSALAAEDKRIRKGLTDGSLTPPQLP